MDFVLPARPVRMQLCSGRGHYDAVIAAVLRARCSVWVATANLKEMMVEERRTSARSRGRFRSILEVFDELARAGVELRILHAKLPSGPFRERFDQLPRLYQGGVELRECPRVHLKTVIVDGRFCYLGSANWTGAGLGAKGEGRRNFEVGVITDDEGILDAVQELYERIWTGRECGACRLRKDGCEAPLDLPTARLVRSRRATRTAEGAATTSAATEGGATENAATENAARESAATERAATERTARESAATERAASRAPSPGGRAKRASAKASSTTRDAATRPTSAKASSTTRDAATKSASARTSKTTTKDATPKSASTRTSKTTTKDAATKTSKATTKDATTKSASTRTSRTTTKEAAKKPATSRAS